MNYKLLIVESPHKADTIGPFLQESGEKWIVKATKGHVRDLPVNEYAIGKVDGEYVAKEVFIDDGKKKIISEISALAKDAVDIYIATDEDREGEKICADIIEFAKIKNYKRVAFKEITKAAVFRSMEEARYVDERIVNAQRARRFIDRFGYKLSNIITWHYKTTKHKYAPDDKKTLGIGRVVCPALKLLVDNARARRNFIPEDYFQISVSYEASNGEEFKLVLERKFRAEQKKELEDAMSYLKNNPHIVKKYDSELKERPPYPPLTTATMQRAAFYGVGMKFKPMRTMELAQKLYESGFITYHRTDGVNLSEEAIAGIITALESYYPDGDIAVEGRRYKAKKSAQNAHEAIRPCYFTPEYYPKNIQATNEWRKANLSEEHWKLYRTIWFRTLMTQMADAVYLHSIVEIECKGIILRGISHYITQDSNGEDRLGWLKIWRNILKENDPDTAEEEKYIPHMNSGDMVLATNVAEFSRTTKKPDRYGLGRFQTVLQDKGIGRPSTFAQIPEGIIKKGYSEDMDGYFEVTPLGESIVKWCEEHPAANWLISIDHAAEFEDKLDAIENGEIESPDELIAEYDDLLEQLKIEVGYKELSELEPTEAMKQKMTAIAAQKNIKLPSDIYSNYEKAALFLKTNSPKYKKLGKCPQCKEGDIVEKELAARETGELFNVYSCTNRACAFKVYDNRVEQFFNVFKRTTEHDERIDIMTGVLKKKSGYEVANLRKKDNTTFDATVVLVNDQKYGWGLSLAKR